MVCLLPRPDEIVTPKDDPMVQEISDVLREWSLVWKRLFAVSDGWDCPFKVEQYLFNEIVM